MKKEVGVYLFIVLIVLVGLSVIFVDFKSTGFAVFDESSISPLDNATLSESMAEFTASVLPGGEGIQNVSLLINGEVNQTNPSVAGEVYTFTVNLPDGTYNWSILVFEDNQSNSTAVRALTVDTTPEEQFLITIHSPLSQTYDTALISLDVSANKEVDGWLYNLNNGGNISFNLSTTITAVEGLNTLIVYANDSEGNSDSENVSFEQCTPDCSGKQCGNDGCGESCGNCDSGETCVDGTCKETPVEPPEELPPEVYVELPPTPELSIQGMDSLILNPLDSKSFNLIATNTGTLSLNACVLVAGGESASWISIPNGSKNFNVGEQQSFSFSVNVPEDAEEKEYSSSLSVQCSELSRTSDFVINVIKKRVSFNLTKVERTRQDRVRVSYLLEDLSGEEQTVYLQFSLFDANNQQVSNASGNHTLAANASQKFRIIVPVNESLEGNLTLGVDLNSEKYSSSVKEPIILGAPTGFLIFEDMGATGNVAVIIGLALIAIAVFFILKRVKYPKKSK